MATTESEKLALEIIVEGFKEFQRQMGELDDTVDTAEKKWGGLGDILGTVGKVGLAAVATGAVAAVGAVAGLTTGIISLTMQAMPVEGLQSAFEGLTAGIEGGSGAMLAALQESSAGMIANRDLMESFNKAAGLVSVDFAEKLPDAMQYLGKVSAATGTDLDFLLDSLVTGVGRLSPMILDNLQVTVSAAEANELYAQSHGLVADELTKGEQQMAMMELTLSKLEEKTAAMPDVTGTAAASMAQWQTQIQNLKDDIGVAFLPVLGELLGMVSELAQEYGPSVVAWAQDLAAWLGEKLPVAIEWVGGFVDTIWSMVQGFRELLAVFTGLGEDSMDTLDNVRELGLALGLSSDEVDALEDAIRNLATWFREVFIPALGEVWTYLVENIVPILQTVWSWIQEHLPGAIEYEMKWLNYWLDVLRIVWAYFVEHIIPILEEAAHVVGVVLAEAVIFLTDLWEQYLLPALTLVWDFVKESLLPMLEALWKLIDASLNVALDYLALLWRDVLYPALEKVWDFLDKYVMPVLTELADVILPALAVGLEIVGNWVRELTEWFDRLRKVIESIEIPKSILPGSPPPLALGLMDIGAAMRQLTEFEIPRLATEFTVLHQVAQPALAGTGSTYSTTYAPQYNLTTQSVTQPGALRLEFQAMEAMATR